MSTNRKKRGRPLGASRLNEYDRKTLRFAAKYLVCGEVNTPTAAFRMAGANNDSHIRRLRRKWKVNSEKYLECAHRKIENKNTSVRTTGRYSNLAVIDRMVAQQRVWHKMANPPHLETIRRMRAQFSVFEQFRNSPTMQLMKAVQDQQKMIAAISRPMLTAERLAKDWNQLR